VTQDSTIPTQQVVSCLLKPDANVSAFVIFRPMCRFLWRVSDLQGVSRRWYILYDEAESSTLIFLMKHWPYLFDSYLACLFVRLPVECIHMSGKFKKISGVAYSSRALEN
jgi:aldehyde:ferredoxin oxidoreductase